MIKYLNFITIQNLRLIIFYLNYITTCEKKKHVKNKKTATIFVYIYIYIFWIILLHVKKIKNNIIPVKKKKKIKATYSIGKSSSSNMWLCFWDNYCNILLILINFSSIHLSLIWIKLCWWQLILLCVFYLLTYILFLFFFYFYIMVHVIDVNIFFSFNLYDIFWMIGKFSLSLYIYICIYIFFAFLYILRHKFFFFFIINNFHSPTISMLFRI